MRYKDVLKTPDSKQRTDKSTVLFIDSTLLVSEILDHSTGGRIHNDFYAIFERY